MYNLSSLKEFKQELKVLSGEASESPEIVSREDFVRALTNKEVMFINNKEDAFLYFASLNLLNTYVKQNKKSISYNFKNDVLSGFDTVIMNNIEGVTYCYDKVEKVILVEIDGLQFSFHNVLPSPKMDYVKNFASIVETKFHKEQQWEGLRLQPVATTLFEYANNLQGLSNKSLVGDLRAYQEERIVLDKQEQNTAQQGKNSKIEK